MTYAGERRIIDADSHLIELDDFLERVADPADRAVLPRMDEQTELPVVPEGLVRGRELFEKRRSDPEVMAKFEASVLDAKRSGWNRLGAFDPEERSHTLDLFGYEMQLVLPTFSFHQVAHVQDSGVLAAGARTLNRAMGGFCAHDERLLAIGYIPLSLGPEEAADLMKRGFEDGCYSFMVDTNEPDPKARSFTHPDFDPIWAGFADASVPAVFHIAVNGHFQAIPPSFHNNGRAAVAAAGDAPAGAIGAITLKNSAEIFLSAMVFDGVFSRHPGLRGISLEHAAVWLPSWLRALDTAVAAFRRLQPELADHELPSETIRGRMKFAPFTGEPVGWIIEQIGADVLVYGSDYPHPEGSSNPIKRFEATMTECDPETMAAFYYGNMREVMGLGAAPQ